MSKPSDITFQQPLQVAKPSADPKARSLAQQIAARLPIPQKIEAASQEALDSRSIQSSTQFAGIWAQTKGFVSQWWNFAKNTDKYLTSDAKVNEVQKEIDSLRTKLNQICGSPVLIDLLHQYSAPMASKLLDLGDDWTPTFLQNMREAILARRGTYFQDYLEVNLLKILDNLVEKVRGDREGPIPPNQLITEMIALGIQKGSDGFADFNTIQKIDQTPGLSAEQKEKQKSAVYRRISNHLIKAALPNGSGDLLLPLPGFSKGLYKLIDWVAMPYVLRQFAETLKSANQEHVELLAELKRVTRDGEAVAGKLSDMARATVQDVLKEKGEVIEIPDKQKEDWLERGLELKSHPMLRAVLSQFLKDCGNVPEMKLLIQKADTFLYPLTVHILGNMAKNADKAAEKKPLLSLIAKDVLKDLREFVEQHPRSELDIALQNYKKQVDELEKVAAENIKELEQECGDVSAPEMAARKVDRDNLIREIQKKKQEFIEQVKCPFSPLVSKLIQKMGVDEKGLTTVLPFFQKYTADWINNYLNKLCLESYQEIVAKEGQLPAAAARMTGYKECRQLIHDMVKQVLPQGQKLLANQFAKSNAQLYKQIFADVMVSPDLTALQPYALPWIVDTVNDLFAHLADSNPMTAGQEKVDMLNGALQHIAHMAVTKLKDASFVARVDQLCGMAEGPGKEKEIKKVFGPLAEEIMQKAFKAGFRLPLKDTAASYLEENLLPKLLCHAAAKWIKIQNTVPINERIIKNRTEDGNAVIKAVKVGAAQTGAALSDKSKKMGSALEAFTDAWAAAVHRQPALKSLNDPILRNALVQLLKGAQDVEPVRELLKKVEGLAYPVFVHVLARLSETAEGKPSTGAAVINNLLKSVFTFAASRRQELAQAFLKEDRQVFKARFKPLVNDIMKNAGLDPEGLEQVIPWGSSALSELIESEAMDFCVDFYEEVSAKEGKASEEYTNLPGYQEARRFLSAALQDSGNEKGLMSTIKETLAKGKNRVLIQNSLADVFNDLLYQGNVPFERNWIKKALKDLLDPSAPHLKKLEGFVQPYIVDSATDLFARLALSYQKPGGEAEGEMVQRAIAHLVTIMKAEVKDSELVKKLTEWKELPEGSDEQKRLKFRRKERLRKELFGQCSSKILDKADVRAPKALRPFAQKLLTESVLPDLLFRIATDMLADPQFSAVEERRLQNMGGKVEFNLIVDGMAEKFTPLILQKAQEYAYLIAAKSNEKLAHSHLSIQEEAWLGKNVAGLLNDGHKSLQPARSFVEFLLSRVLHRGLIKLALKAEQEGDLAGNAILYLRDRFRNFPLKPTLRETIRIYSEQTAPLKELDQQIDKLRKQAIQDYPRISQTTTAELARLKRERVLMELEIDKKDGIKATYQEILKAFEPEVKKLMDDMGYEKADNLPVPFFLKEIIWKNLSASILPYLCLTSAEKLIEIYDMLIPRRKELEKEVKKYEDLLTQWHIQTQRKSDKDYRLPPNVKVSPMVSAIERVLPDFVEKFVESQAALKGKDVALKAIDDFLIPTMYSGVKGRAAALQVEAHRKEIASWIDQESAANVAILKERFGKALKDLMKATMLKSAYHFLHNLEALEKDSPEKLFDFMFHALPLAADHVKLTTSIAQKQKGLLKTVHIHQIDSLTILKEFEKAGKLHPAMPGVKEFRALLEEEEHIRQLDKVVDKGLRKGSNWHKNVDRLKVLPKEPESEPDSFLEAAKRNQEELLKKIDGNMKENFFNDFSKYLLKMAGVKGPQDLPGGEAFLKKVWEMTSKASDVENEIKNNPQNKRHAEQKAWEKFVEANMYQPAASGMIELVKTALSTEQLNNYLAMICKGLNEKLKAYKISSNHPVTNFEQSAAANDKMDEMEARCQTFWKQVKRMLPVSVVKELQELPLIEQIPGKKMAEWTRSILREYPLSKMIETGMAKIMHNLPEKLPMSIEEAKELERIGKENDTANIKQVRDQAAQTVPILVEMIERNIDEAWKKIHRKIEAWLLNAFGQSFVVVKTTVDQIFHTVFITFFMGPIYKFARWLLSYGLVLWGMVVSRDVEVARRNIVMQDPDRKTHKEERTININANLLLRMADEFKKLYPAPA